MASPILAPTSQRIPSATEEDIRIATLRQILLAFGYYAERMKIDLLTQDNTELQKLCKRVAREYDEIMPRCRVDEHKQVPVLDSLPNPGFTLPDVLNFSPNDPDSLNAVRWFTAGLEAGRAQERRPS